MRSKKNKKKIIIAIVLGIVATMVLNGLSSNQKAVVNNLNKQLQKQSNALDELKKNPFAKEPVQDEKISVVLAAQDIKPGDTFLAEILKTEKYNDNEAPDGHYKVIAMLVGKKAGKNITAGQFITESDIQSDDIKAIDIPPGMRAISIPVERFRGLSSLIRVGSIVDILKAKNPPEFIAQNIEIISFEAAGYGGGAGQIGEASLAGSADSLNLNAMQASSITFLIPIDIVQTVIESMITSQLQIITRNRNDVKVIITEEELPPPPLTPEIAVKVPELPTPSLPAPEPRKVELIEATNISTIEFNEEESYLNFEEDGASSDNLKELLDMVK